MEALANSDVTDVNTYNFRSLQEMVEYVRQLDRSAREDIADIKTFRKLFEPAKLKTIRRLQVVKSAIKIVRELKEGDLTKTPTSVAPGARKPKPKEGESIPVQFNAPKHAELMKKYSAIGRLHSKVEIMDAMINNATSEFKLDAGFSAAYKWMKDTRKKMQSELDKSYKFLTEVAKKTEPKEFKSAVRAMVKKIQEAYSELYEGSLKESAFVTPQKDSKGEISFVYNHYVELSNVINDKDIVIPKYFIVFTGIVSPMNTLRMYFTTLEHFAAPGYFKPKHSFTKVQTAWEQLQIAFEAEQDISTFMHRQAIDVTPQQLKATKWNVPKGFITHMMTEGNIISFGIDAKQIDNLADAKGIADVLNRDLIEKAILSPGKGAIRRRGPYKSGNAWVVEFIVAKPSRQFIKNVQLNQRLVDTLTMEFGWDPEDAAIFVRTFNKVVRKEFYEDEV